MQSRHSKLYCLCSRDIQNFIVCAVATFKTLLFVKSRHSKLYCLCSGDIQNFIVCAVETFETLLFVQSRHSKLYCLCSRAIRNFLVCVSLLGLRTFLNFTQTISGKMLTKMYFDFILKPFTRNAFILFSQLTFCELRNCTKYIEKRADNTHVVSNFDMNSTYFTIPSLSRGSLESKTS